MQETWVQSLGQEDALEKGMATTLTEQLNFHFTSQMIARILCLPTIQSLNSEQLAGGAEASPAWWPASTVLSGCAHTPPTGKEPRDLRSTSTSCPMLCMCASSVTSVVSDALQPRGLYSSPGSCLCNSLGKNTGVSYHAFLQGIFPTRDQTRISCTAGRFFTH